MRFNKAAAGALIAGASLARADEYCSDRSTIVVTEYVTLPGPVNSTPASAESTPLASSSVDGAASSPTPTASETTSVQVVTLTPVPATSSPPLTTSTLYSTSSTVNGEGETIYMTVSSTTTCTNTRTVTVDPPAVTVTVQPSASSAADGAVGAAEYTPSSSSSVSSSTSVAVDTPSYTPAPVSSTPAVTVESVTPSSSTSSAPAATSSDSSLVGSVGGAVTALTEAVTGEATYYTGDISSGTCSFTGYTLPSSIFGTALSDSNWESAGNCGACVSIKGPSGDAITAMIVDKCPGCGTNHLDLFEDAFSSLSALATGVINVSWEIVECGITSPLKLTNKDGASEYWFSMQVVNSNLPVKSLSVSIDGGSTWTETTRTDYNFFEYEQGFGTTTVDVKVTSTTGKEVITKNVTIGSATSHECDSNF
ncbi:RlpA-like double-psi beta-barrel-protein domain-containing protein-containing protein [Macrophomina phaseolina]|uniref:RlpA-like double-psi beta-barrel-protein domain-containing protein-containing protein n=1 Tax=Macrophomina phaseolina TaxID=35725 RepID=A0ABQ8G388_9PEZI|nr:RlpA-like double-psi beta-barrel-protein domain-containing protein-containing protein [Macrophomina phaseolina]